MQRRTYLKTLVGSVGVGAVTALAGCSSSPPHEPNTTTYRAQTSGVLATVDSESNTAFVSQEIKESIGSPVVVLTTDSKRQIAHLPRQPTTILVVGETKDVVADAISSQQTTVSETYVNTVASRRILVNRQQFIDHETPADSDTITVEPSTGGMVYVLVPDKVNHKRELRGYGYTGLLVGRNETAWEPVHPNQISHATVDGETVTVTLTDPPQHIDNVSSLWTVDGHELQTHPREDNTYRASFASSYTAACVAASINYPFPYTPEFVRQK